MACPYFYPVARFESSPWSVPPRLPLGDAFAGECWATGCANASHFQPDESRMREVCNLGYGRATCEQFPRDSAPSDAVRFHVGKDDGELVQIQYVFERDCWPARQGMLECTGSRGMPAVADEILRRQAEAFLESYIRRRDAA